MTAYNMDKKTDDVLPASGRVQAVYLNAGGPTAIPAPNAATPSSSTCYDTTSNQYSVSQNNGAGVNCVLSSRFQ